MDRIEDAIADFKEEFERILDGDYEWMASARESSFRDFYLQLTINQLRPGSFC